MRRLPVALVAILALAACKATEPPAAPAAPSQPIESPGEECTPEGVAAAGLVPAGKLDDDTAILPNGRRVAPEGARVEVGGVPLDFALSPDAARAYVLRQKRGIVVVDLATNTVIQTVSQVSGHHGIALSATGDVLWAAATSGVVFRFPVRADGQLDAPTTGAVRGFLVDLLPHPDGRRVFALSNTNSNIYELDATTLEVTRTLRAGRNPYALAIDEAGSLLFASNLGSNSVTVFDLATGEARARVEVCANPEGMVLPAGTGRLYVACSNRDAVAVVDIATLAVVETIDLTGDPDGLVGGAVNELAYSPATGRLFVSQARRDKVDIVRLSDGVVEGSLATGHYPTMMALTPDGATLIVAAAKGFGSQDHLDDIRGHLNVIPVPTTPEALAAATARVDENNRRPGGFYPESCGAGLPPALAGGPDRPIEHVVLLVRENKTYDALLGDLEGANGDPALAVFGEDITPNLHALARQFTNLDNFYSDAENSIQGHQWTTQADCNDFVEKIRRVQLPVEGFDPATKSGGGSIFEHCWAHGVSFRNYGEIVGFAEHMLDEFAPFIDHKYPFFNLAIPDIEKAGEFVRELESGIFPEFVYIGLPNDHTSGTKPGAPTPRWMVGDNDAGTGIIVEAIMNSPFWPETVIFIIEDDPQGPGDHVNAHRSPCVVVSPHVRRAYTSSVLHSNPSLYRTIELLLELPPLNRNTREASPMVDIFVTGTPGDEPDFTPWSAVANPIPYEENAEDAPMAKESMAIDWTRVDEAPGLGLILWRSMRGDEPLPDYAYRIDD